MAVQTRHSEQGKTSDHLHPRVRTWFSRYGGSRAEGAAYGSSLGAVSGKGEYDQRPMPVYPANPPWTSKQGRGVYEIHVNQTGVVTEVKILKPSGDPTFDNVTVSTLHKWRLRHGPKIIELPLAFVMTPDNCRVWIP